MDVIEEVMGEIITSEMGVAISNELAINGHCNWIPDDEVGYIIYLVRINLPEEFSDRTFKLRVDQIMEAMSTAFPFRKHIDELNSIGEIRHAETEHYIVDAHDVYLKSSSGLKLLTLDIYDFMSLLSDID